MAANKAGRETRQGLIEAYVHPGGRWGALVEVNCETDFVARTDTFKELARDLAMHITATNPRYVDLAAVPAEELQAKTEELRREALAEGKPETVVDQIVEGKLKKFAEEFCLLDQPWVRDPEKTIRERIHQAVATTNENIQVRRFARYQLGGE